MAKQEREPKQIQPDSISNNGANPQPTPPDPAGIPFGLDTEDELGDLDQLRLSQDFSLTVGGQRMLTTVAVRRPRRHEFIRVRPDEPGTSWHFQTALYVDESERGEVYLVAPQLWPELGDDLRPTCLFTTITRQNTVFLWPARLPGADRRASSWHTSAIEAAKMAMQCWVRVKANQEAGAYETWAATGYTAEPEWPHDITMDSLIRLAFKGRYITTWNHPVLQQLRGEA
jgi:hypothetical protein